MRQARRPIATTVTRYRLFVALTTLSVIRILLWKINTWLTLGLGSLLTVQTQLLILWMFSTLTILLLLSSKYFLSYPSSTQTASAFELRDVHTQLVYITDIDQRLSLLGILFPCAALKGVHFSCLSSFRVNRRSSSNEALFFTATILVR